MANTCSTCFFYKGGNCHINAPRLGRFASVEPTDWCGEGSDAGTGVSFSNSINSLAGPVGPQGPAGPAGPAGTPAYASKGTFVCANAATTVVADANVAAGSLIFFTPADASAAQLVRGAGGAGQGLYVSAKNAGVSFTVATDNAGAAVGTETFNYIVVN